MADTKAELKIREKQLNDSRAYARKINSEFAGMMMKMSRYQTEIAELKRTHEQNGQLNDLNFICKREGLESSSSISSITGSKSINMLTKLNQKFIELQKQVTDIKLVISESGLRIKTIENQLETSKKSLSNANLKGEQSSKSFQHNQMLEHEVESCKKKRKILVQNENQNLPCEDALKAVEETEDHRVSVEKISNLEEEVVSLKQKLESLTFKNDKLNHEMVENVKALTRYITQTELAMEIMKDELQAKKDLEQEAGKYKAEISELRSTHEQKEKIWNGVTERLQKEKSELVDELTNKLNQKDDQPGVLPSFDDVQKLTNKLKLIVLELERLGGGSHVKQRPI